MQLMSGLMDSGCGAKATAQSASMADNISILKLFFVCDLCTVLAFEEVGDARRALEVHHAYLPHPFHPYRLHRYRSRRARHERSRPGKQAGFEGFALRPARLPERT